MYYQPEAMLEQYDIEIKQITKGRGVFCCETDQGKKVLAPFRGSAERAKFVREILCSMQEKGYPVEQVSLTKDRSGERGSCRCPGAGRVSLLCFILCYGNSGFYEKYKE